MHRTSPAKRFIASSDIPDIQIQLSVLKCLFLQSGDFVCPQVLAWIQPCLAGKGVRRLTAHMEGRGCAGTRTPRRPRPDSVPPAWTRLGILNTDGALALTPPSWTLPSVNLFYLFLKLIYLGAFCGSRVKTPAANARVRVGLVGAKIPTAPCAQPKKKKKDKKKGDLFLKVKKKSPEDLEVVTFTRFLCIPLEIF